MPRRPRNQPPPAFQVGDHVCMTPDTQEVFEGAGYPVTGVVTDVRLPRRRGWPAMVAVHGQYWHPENWQRVDVVDPVPGV